MSQVQEPSYQETRLLLLAGVLPEAPKTMEFLANASNFEVVAVGAMKPDDNDMPLTCVVLCGEGGCIAVASVFYAHVLRVWPTAVWSVARTKPVHVVTAHKNGQMVAVMAPWRIYRDPGDGELLPSDFWTQGELAGEEAEDPAEAAMDVVKSEFAESIRRSTRG